MSVLLRAYRGVDWARRALIPYPGTAPLSVLGRTGAVIIRECTKIDFQLQGTLKMLY